MLEQVYDVTKFLDDHPGGDEVLLSATGKAGNYIIIFVSFSILIKYR